MNMNKLKGKIIEKGLNVDRLASKTGIHRSSIYRKMNKPENFTVKEVKSIKETLMLTNEEAAEIFFN